MHYTHSVATSYLHQRGGHYLWIVKPNQPDCTPSFSDCEAPRVSWHTRLCVWCRRGGGFGFGWWNAAEAGA